jgi:hypothetical protein
MDNFARQEPACKVPDSYFLEQPCLYVHVKTNGHKDPHGLFLEATYYVGDLAIGLLKSGWLKLLRA